MGKKVIVSKKPKSNIVNNSEDLGKIIEYYRTNLGMSRDEISGYCNLNYRTLQKLEKGDGSLKVENLFKILNNLGIELRVGKDI